MSSLQKSAQNLSSKLNELVSEIKKLPQTTKFSDSWSWQASTLDKYDFSYMAKELAEQIESIDWPKSNEDSESILDDLADKVGVAITNNAQNLYSGPQASEALYMLLSCIDFQLNTIASPEQARRMLSSTSNIRKVVSAATHRLEEATNQIVGIEQKILTINSAHDAAEKLPLTIEDLEIAVKEIEGHKVTAAKYDLSCEQSFESINKYLEKIKLIRDEADNTLSKVQSTYQAVTSQGLAHAFKKKSDDLEGSVKFWMWVLICALIVAGLLSYFRIPAVLENLTSSQSLYILIVRFFLGVSVIAPPVWLAWVATKQIGQRFRLAEDYAYKAALSAAYEGYKSEAANLDSMLEARLFSIAIDRLDEIPGNTP